MKEYSAKDAIVTIGDIVCVPSKYNGPWEVLIDDEKTCESCKSFIASKTESCRGLCYQTKEIVYDDSSCDEHEEDQ